uniref:Tumor necrosis factor alpha-induced protein 8-like protein 1 n=2 Tax=Meleagris gallopavo TaxID=9103 RepID=G3UP37_MELGA
MRDPPMQFRAPHCPPSNLQSCRAPLRAFQCPSEPPGAQQCPLEPSRAPQEPLRVGGTTLSGGRGPLPHPHLGRSTATARWISSPPRGGFSRRYWAAAQRHRNDSSGWSCPRVPDCRAPAGAGQSRSTSGKGHPSRCRCPPGEREARPSVLPLSRSYWQLRSKPRVTIGQHRRCAPPPLQPRSAPLGPEQPGGTGHGGVRDTGTAPLWPGTKRPRENKHPVPPEEPCGSGTEMDSFSTKSLALQAQKKLLSKMASKTMANVFIDDTSSEILDELYRATKEYTHNRKEAQKIIKNLIKIVMKLGVLYRNGQFSPEELLVMERFRKKVHTLAMTAVSFHQIDFTFDRRVMSSVLMECRDLLHQAVSSHLTAKSHSRINHVFNHFADYEFLSALYGPAEPYRTHLKRICEGVNKMLEEDNI